MKIAMFGHKRIPSREGGIGIVVEELATRMAAMGHEVICYNRGGHHVSGKEYDTQSNKNYRGIHLKNVWTINRRGIAAVTSSFFAAIAAAFVEKDIRKVMDIALALIPEDSGYYRMAKDIYAYHDAHAEKGWRSAMEYIIANWGYDRYPGNCHVIPNSAVMIMSMLYGAQMQSMMPKLRSDNVPGMELIRPLYKVHEEQIIRWRDDNHLEFLQCACKMTEERYINEDGSSNSKRAEMKELMRHLRSLNPIADRNIFHSVHNVSLDTMVRWKYEGKEYHFLDHYDDPKE